MKTRHVFLTIVASPRQVKQTVLFLLTKYFRLAKAKSNDSGKIVQDGAYLWLSASRAWNYHPMDGFTVAMSLIQSLLGSSHVDSPAASVQVRFRHLVIYSLSHIPSNFQSHLTLVIISLISNARLLLSTEVLCFRGILNNRMPHVLAP